MTDPDAGGSSAALAPAHLAGLFAAVPTGMAVLDLQGRVVASNPAFQALVGRDGDTLHGRALDEVTDPDDRVATALVRDDAGSPLAITVTATDETDRRRAEAERSHQRDLLDQAGKLSRVGGWALDLPERIQTWTDEIFRILEVPEDVAPPPVDQVIARYRAPGRERLLSALDACAEQGAAFDLDLDVDTFAGRHRRVRAIGEAIRDEQGRIRRIIGAFQDITELRAAERRSADVGRRLASTLTSMSDAFFVVDHDWRFTFLNPQAGRLLQRDPAELVGRVVWDEFPEAVGSDVYRAYHRAMETGRTQTVEAWYFPLLETWFGVNAYPGPQGLAVYFRDVTERARTALALEERERRVAERAALLDEAQDAISVRDLDGVVTSWNRGAQRLYGWSADVVVGRPLPDELAVDGRAHREAWDQVLATGRWTGELRTRRRDGDERLVETRLTLLRDDDGTPRSVLSIDTDVTDRRRMEQQLLRTQRMESIGSLAGGIAHDLNNVLAPIRMALHLLDDGADDERGQLLATMEASARRGAELVRQVLAFARGERGERGRVAVRELIDEIDTIARATFPRGVRLDIEPPPEDLVVHADPTQLHQLLMNLFVNARDAVAGAGTIRCRAELVELDPSPPTNVASPSTVAAGPYVAVDVEDDGPGMSADVADRVFEPFFTTKAVGDGTGLGLATCLGIARSHGGQVQLTTAPGEGTRFRILLPAVDDPDLGSAPARGDGRGRS
jgi:two-component system, cell cycle sensor histidine kinase and response regulator CckA